MLEKNKVEVTTMDAGGYGDIAGAIRIAEYLSSDYEVILALGTYERRKFDKLMDGETPAWEVVDEGTPTGAPVRIAAFESHRNHRKSKDQVEILVNQLSYKYISSDLNFYTGFLPDDAAVQFQGEGTLLMSGLYIPKDTIKCSKNDAVEKFDKFSKKNKIRNKEEDFNTDTLWGTYYSGTIGTDGLFFDMLKEAQGKLDRDATIFTFLDDHHFKKYVVPKAEQLGLEYVVHKDKKLRFEFVVSKGKTLGFDLHFRHRRQWQANNQKQQAGGGNKIKIVNLGIVPEPVYKAFVGSADLINVSAGDGSFTLGYKALLDNKTPLLKFYNRDQHEAIDGLIDWSRKTEKRLDYATDSTSRIVAGFAAGERLWNYEYKIIQDLTDKYESKPDQYGPLLKRFQTHYTNAAGVNDLAKLLYDEKTRDEYSRVLGSIPDTMREEFEKRGLSPQKAAILPNVLDVVKYAVDRTFELGDSKQMVEEFKKSWPSTKSYFSRKRYSSKMEKKH